MKNKVVDTAGGGEIVVDNPVVYIHKPVALEVPKAAALLMELPAEAWRATLEEIIEYGATAFQSVRISASMQLLEARTAELLSGLHTEIQDKLGSVLQGDRDAIRELVTKAFSSHLIEFNKMMTRYCDPSSKDGFPSVMVGKLDEVVRAGIKQIDGMIQGGEDSALGKVVQTLAKQIAEVERNLCAQIAAKHALMTKSAHKGEPFEQVITAVLSDLVRPYGGEVDHCAYTLGVRRQRHGDHVITFKSPMTRDHPIRVAIEAKDHEGHVFSLDAVRTACRQSRENREAVACIFVGASPEILPDGRSFGPVGGADFFVAFNPEEGNDLGLALTLYLVLMQAVLDIGAGGGDSRDMEAAQAEIAKLRTLLEQFADIETCQNSAVKSIQKATLLTSSLKGQLLTALSRLETILAA